MKAINTFKLLSLTLPIAALCAFTAPAHAVGLGVGTNGNANVSTGVNTDTGVNVGANTSVDAETKIKQDADGDYTKTTSSESTDAAGTTQDTETKEKVDVDANGDTTTERKTETTTDPKGLNNKVTSEESEKTTEKANGEMDSKVVSDRSENGGSHDRTETKKTVRNDSRGHRHIKVASKKTHDPKGLMNKVTEKLTESTDEKANGQVETHHEVQVNGKTTEKTDQIQ
ncbi:MAG TPA: hypothetical protein VL625_02545 [Patescibacteria group bacterium]|jgi:hypothetical protein|nr:hypothetical protein [Patescibacteria group bacterium]